MVSFETLCPTFHPRVLPDKKILRARSHAGRAGSERQATRVRGILYGTVTYAVKEFSSWDLAGISFVGSRTKLQDAEIKAT